MINFFQSNLPEGVTIGHNGTDRILEIIAAILLVAVWGMCFYIYSIADAPIAIHFNLAGEPNDWGSSSSVFIHAGAATLSMCLMAIAAYQPTLVNLPVKLKAESLSRQYTLMGRLVRLCNVILGCMFIFILLSTGAPFWEMKDAIFVLFTFLLVIIMFAVIGYYSYLINHC